MGQAAGFWILLCGCLLLAWTGLQPGSPREDQGSRVPPKPFRTLLAVPEPDPEEEEEEAAVQDGIFWSPWLERLLLPSGFPEAEVRAWEAAVRAARVLSLERGCGRSSNRLAVLSDGSRACVRVGINPEQIQGEALSFYLARLLGITNVPPVALARAGSPQWAPVQDELRRAQWPAGAIVSLTPWIHNLTGGVVPPAALRSGGGGDAGGLHSRGAGLQNRSRAELLELVQWTDLIVFDYLTANFDRLVSNLVSLQWDRRVMERGTSNLHRRPGGGLVLLDNEAGLVHGYRLRSTWDRYNEPLLRSVCLFRHPTAAAIAELHRRRDAPQRLRTLYMQREPLAGELGFLAPEHARHLQSRIDLLHGHIAHCRAKYGR
ncbi:four-jointed box protein 1 [Microcaecilia unicolor]|uniref:Four-jointed box protein 1 n=1 Tax=Microcaecilia unicolor TaxID=1415580 RepID=A0A6P7XXA6_9AMPH|nr:four-jointed box protein 1 [Microcaecilia unicolor]